MNVLKKIAKYSTILLISGFIVSLLLIKMISLVLEGGQKIPLFGYEKAIAKPLKKEVNDIAISKNSENNQRIVPKSIAINHDEYPTLTDLREYLWWSEKSQQIIRFTEQYRQAIKDSVNDNHNKIISQFPYQVKGNILYCDFSQVENPMHIEEYTSMIMNWKGGTLALTPNDNHENKEERSDVLLPVKQIK
ncbi:hypothetical protein VNN41_05630 [Lactococcus garvieae]|uniref:hypothetical protein n=1 Tax=Lactococcus garvieae TaxID=1363 RepID=UPI003244AB99